MSQPAVLYEVKDGVALITLNRPEKMNAGVKELQQALYETVIRADADPDARVIVVTGSGRAFMAGADLNLLATADPLTYREYTLTWRKMRHLMHQSGKPTIAAVNGYAYGAGAVIAWSCDLVIASETAKFGLQEILVGQFAAVSFLPNLISRMQAAELILFGEPISAERAMELGLVNKVVPPEQLMDTTMEWARKLVEKVPRSLAMAKRLLHWQAYMPDPIADLVEVEMNALMFNDEEKQRVTKAYYESVTKKKK